MGATGRPGDHGSSCRGALSPLSLLPPPGSSSQAHSWCLGEFSTPVPGSAGSCLCSALTAAPGAGRAALGSVQGVQGWIPLPSASLDNPAPSQSLGEVGAVTSALSLAGSKGQQHSQCQEVQGTHAFPWTCHPGPGRAQEKRLPASSKLTQRLVPPPLFCTTQS